MQHSVLTRQSGQPVQPRQVYLTVSFVYTHPVQGLASPRTLDYKKERIQRPVESGGASDHQRATQPTGQSATHCGASKGLMAGGSRQVAALQAGPAVRSRCYAKPSRSRRRRGC